MNVIKCQKMSENVTEMSQKGFLTFCWGGGGQPTWAIEKNEKYDELRDGRHMRQGQDRELYPILPLIGRAGQ